jgi:hypothetical protein
MSLRLEPWTPNATPWHAIAPCVTIRGIQDLPREVLPLARSALRIEGKLPSVAIAPGCAALRTSDSWGVKRAGARWKVGPGIPHTWKRRINS